MDNGQRLVIKNINSNDTATFTYKLSSPLKTTVQHKLYRPGSLEIIKFLGKKTPKSKIVCEVTNLRLSSSIHINLPEAQVTFQKLANSEYSSTRILMDTLRTGGVLSEIDLIFFQDVSEKQMDEFVRLSCSLLSIAQRAHVWCVARHWKNSDGDIVKSRYEEPIFYNSRPGIPLIPVDSLGEFFQDSIDNYEIKNSKWNLAEAQEHYLQSMQINSAWAQSLGFFTALETLKAAYLRRIKDKNLERYVSQKDFRKKKITDKVLNLLCENFKEFKEIVIPNQHDNIDNKQKEKIDLEKETLKSKVSELNRRAYKLVLKKMFKELGIAVEDQELKQLVDMRNQIIHTGRPDYKKWTPSEAMDTTFKFCGLLLEESLLGILE